MADGVSPYATEHEVVDAVGKVLVVRTTAGESGLSLGAAQTLQRRTGATCVLVLPHDAKVETLDEDEMRAAGWVRA